MQSESHASRSLRPMLSVVAAGVVLVGLATIPLPASRLKPVESRAAAVELAAVPKPGPVVVPDARIVRAAPAQRAPTPKPAAPPEQRGSESATRDAALTQLTSTWQSEERDFVWTDDARDYIATLLQDAHVPPERLVASDCRQSLCRVELRFESEAEAGQAYDLRHPDYDLRVFADGLTYTLFFPREGKKLGD